MVLLKLPLVVAIFGVFSEAALGLLPWDATVANVTWTPVTDPSLGAQAKKAKALLIPYTYIVKLSSNPEDLSTRDLSPHQAFHKRAESIVTYTTRHEYTNSSLFLGLSLTLSSANDVQTLRDLENVEKIWPVYSVSRPLAIAKPHSLLSSTLSTSNLATRDSNTTFPHISYSGTSSSPLQISNVDKLHASGIKGIGIKIAVIDTGVDYRHPSLGGCFGAGCKISFGYDLVGDNYPDTTTPSPDPLTTCAPGGHGTHVMGIIGMEDSASEGFGLIGVAPEATLGMYRVFGCAGSAGSDVVIAGMLMAASDGADVISMSLGSLSPSEADNPFQEITETLSAQGVAVIVAAGNDGNLGPFSTSAPAIGTTVLAIGSVDNKNFPVTYQLSDTRGRHFRYASIFPINTTASGMSIIILANGEVSDVTVCYEFEFADAAAKLVDPETTILAIKTGGTCTTTTKVQAAAGYGFKYIMLYSTADSKVTSYLNYFAMEPLEDSVATLVVTAENALSIITEAGKNPAYKLFFNSTTASNYLAQSPVQVTGGFMSNYSSFGPSTELDMKPQLSAPGGNILSSWPLAAGGYAILSGTSMATPFAAGCYALVKSQLPSLTANEIFNLLMNSASPLPWYYNTAILSSAAHQGTGLLDPHAAITYESTVFPQQLNLGASAAPVKRTITIKNRSSRSKTYILSHKPAGVVNGGEYRTDFISQTYPSYASVSFSSPTISVPGSSSATIEITITPPVGISPALQPVYSGYLIATNNNDRFVVPYVGEPWDPNTVNIIAETVPWKLKYPNADGNYIVLVPAGIYAATQFLIAPTYPDTTLQDFFMGGLGYPGLLFGTTQACDYIRFDAVPANTTFVPDIYGYDPNLTYDDLVYPAGNVTEVLGLDIVKMIVEYEGPFGQVGSATYKWLDTKLPLGDYRVVMRVLRPGKDYDDPKSWNSWMSAVARFE